MTSRVLDCNVLAAASGLATHQPGACTNASARELAAAARGIVLLDDGDAIIGAYRAHADLRGGQPGPAELFLRFLFQVRYDRKRCLRVSVPQGSDGSFLDYPLEADFRNFDPDDRVYVAVAVASRIRPRIVNATDTDWLGIEEPLLRKYGIPIEHLCDVTPRVTADDP